MCNLPFVILSSLYATALAGIEDQTSKTADPVATQYSTLCAGCHGQHLEGGMATSLRDDVWLHGGDDNSLATSVRDGYPGVGMPSFGKSLSEEEIRKLIIYIREVHAEDPAYEPNADVRIPAGIVKSEQQSFRVEVVKEELNTPWAMAFLPDGNLLVAKRGNRYPEFRAKQNPGGLGLLTLKDRQLRCIEGLPQRQGVFDVALHPDFARNGWIYISSAEFEERPQGANDKFQPREWVNLSRGRLRGDRWVDGEPLLHLETVLMTGRIAFDDAGHVFLSVAANIVALGPDSPAQNLFSAGGKIHRIQDDGRIPADNPFLGMPQAILSIWSYGHRNPQGLTFDRRTGRLWETEHGPRGGDELNLIERGNNYGWPVITYGMDHGGTPIGEGTAKAGMEQSVVQWTPSIGVLNLRVYEGRAFPRWRHDLLIGSGIEQTLFRLQLKDDRVVHQEAVLTHIGRVRDIAVDADGLVYLLTENYGRDGDKIERTGRILRLVP